ncbi:GNAT family N-acetyltransferase [Acidothermaceae bacterium B102]|nr:GNAT family N-acetyltransferase [Acidothermaceae bacterium B102]
MTDEIRTPRLLLRRWREDDREPFAAMNADPAVMEHFTAPLTREQSDGLIDLVEAYFEEHGYGWWAVENEQGFVGFTGLHWLTWDSEFTPALEIGWRLAVPAWGHGYATEAATAVVARGFEDVDSLVSITAASNTRSMRVMERLGMHREREFDHPNVPEGHPVRPHVLYRLRRP